MNHKHFFTGLFMVLGLVSGMTGCIAADGEDSSEQWTSDEDLSEESAQTQVNAAPVVSPAPQYPNCGILACPSGTTCQFDSAHEARCTAPPNSTCSQVACGPYFHCQMAQTDAICVPGSSDS